MGRGLNVRLLLFVWATGYGAGCRAPGIWLPGWRLPSSPTTSVRVWEFITSEVPGPKLLGGPWYLLPNDNCTSNPLISPFQCPNMALITVRGTDIFG